MALLLTLVVVGLLAALVIQFNYQGQVELELARSYAESVQAAYLAEAGVEVAKALIRTDDPKVDSLEDQWAMAIPVIPVEEGFVTLTIEDANRRLGLNRLLNATGTRVNEPLAGVLEELLRQLGRDDAPALVDALLDWMDPDDEVRPQGAEQNDYGGATPPVVVPNRPLLSPGELGMVKGFDHDLLYGSDELPGLLTLVSPWGDGRVNLNTADPEPGKQPWILMSLGGADKEGKVALDPERANQIRDSRLDDPFTSPIQVKTRGILEQAEYNAIQTQAAGILTTQSTTFIIQATGAVGNADATGGGNLTQRTITTVVHRTKSGRLQTLYWREE
ncbi:MAG: general secretion pathway protein GspK [Nitrospirae bacterium]|nr:MAG: general secretion pathway protein GspK [Nitrospirota bacterium]